MKSRTPETKTPLPAEPPSQVVPATGTTQGAATKPAPAKRSNARKGPAPKGRHRW
jgi:hypothetical protein